MLASNCLYHYVEVLSSIIIIKVLNYRIRLKRRSKFSRCNLFGFAKLKPVVLISVLLLPILFLSQQKSIAAVEDWYNFNWKYRSSLTINNSLSYNLTSNTVANWHLNESAWSGQVGEVIDSSTNSFHGQAISDAATDAGKLNRAGSFDGSDGYVSIPNNASQNAFPITVEAWINTTDAGSNKGIISKYGSSNGYQIFISGGRLKAWYFKNADNRLRMDATTYDGGIVNDGQWHHVAFTVDEDEGLLYVDGVKKNRALWTGIYGASSSALPIKIGAYGTGYFTGLIDEARIFNKALTQEEIKAEYNRSTGTEATSGIYYGNELTNYPVKVELSSANFNFDLATDTGSDLRFTESDGKTLLNYSIESYDKQAEEAVIWVKIPSITTSQTIYCYFGNGSASSASDGESTFSYFEGFDQDFSLGEEVGINDLTQLQSYENNEIIPLGSAESWDSGIREIGNVLYDTGEPDAAKRYKTLYSGYNGVYADTNVYIGYAYSADGVTWTKVGKVIDRSLEDPYLVKNNGTYYLFVEDKGDVPFRNVRKYHSSDCISWTDDGDAFDIGVDDWENTDVSSPTVLIKDGTWYMYYEGRGTGSSGQIGLVTSNDGITWSRSDSNPVIGLGNAGTWDETSIIPDDIIETGGEFLQFYHGYSTTTGTTQMGFAHSADLVNWTRDEANPIMGISDTAMVYLHPNGHYYFHSVVNYGGGIRRYLPYKYDANNFPYSDKFAIVQKGTKYYENVSSSNGVLSLSSPRDTTARASIGIRSLDTFTNDSVIEFRTKVADYGASYYSYYSLGSGIPVDANGTEIYWENTLLRSGYSLFMRDSATTQIYKMTDGVGSILGLKWTPNSSITDNFNTHQLTYSSDGELSWGVGGSGKTSAYDQTYLSSEKNLLIAQGEFTDGSGGELSIDWIRVRPVVDFEPSIGYAAQSGFPTAVITLTEPTNLSTIQLPVLLKWSSSLTNQPGISGFQIIVDNQIVNTVASSSNRLSLSSLTAGEHTWKVRAINGNGEIISQSATSILYVPAASTSTPSSAETSDDTDSSEPSSESSTDSSLWSQWPWWLTGSSSATFTIPTDITDIEIGEEVTFDANSLGSNIIKYQWDFGDGATSSDKKVNHKYTVPGRYTVTLTTTEKSGKISTISKTVDIRPLAPTISKITSNGTGIIFSGESFPQTTVNLLIHSIPYTAEAVADSSGKFSHTLENASETIGEGDHTVLASAAVLLSDNTQLKGKDSKTYDFKVSVDNGKLKVEMGKTKSWRTVSIVLGGIIIVGIIGFVLYRRRMSTAK